MRVHVLNVAGNVWRCGRK